MKLKFSNKIELLKNYLKEQIEKNDENQDIFKKMLKELEANPSITYKDLVTGEQNNPTKREKDNLEALELLKKIQKGEIQVTNEVKEKLAKYTGNGGTSTGSKDEYYTPKYVAQNSWKLFGNLDENSVILDPSSGTGIFSQSKPRDVKMVNIEIQSTSAGINKILNPNDKVINASFEKASEDIEDNSIDGVITNVPFMPRDMTLDTDSFFNNVTRLEDYFIIKSLQKLKYGKRAIFILPTGVIDNTQRRRVKQKMLNYGSFLGAIRLPNKVFSHTGANVSVDIAVFEKHPKNVILALKQGLIVNGGINKYIYKNELNNQFLNGIYFEKHTKNVLGVMVDTKTFMESKFYDNHTMGTQVLTTDDLNTIKDKLNIKVNELQTNLINTTEYDKLEISGGINVLSAEAGKVIYANDKLLAKFKDYNSLEKFRQTELKSFYKNWVELNSINNRQLLFIHKLVNNHILSSIIAVNGAKNKDKVNYKEALNIFNAIELLKVLKDKKELNIKNDSKKLAKLNETLRMLFNKKNTSKFKTKEKEVRYSKMYNEEIGKLLSDIRMFLMKWDFDKLEFIDFNSEIPPLKSLTFDDIASFNENKVMYDEEKGVSYIELSELKNHKDDLLKNDDVVIIDNKVYPFKIIAKYGRKFNEAKKELENLEYTPNDVINKEEFEEKKEKLLIYLDSFKKSISIDKLNITFTNKDILLTPNALNIAKQWFDREIKSFYRETPFVPKMTDKNSDFEKFGDRISSSVSTYTAKDTNPFYKLTLEEKLKLDNTFNSLQDETIKENWKEFVGNSFLISEKLSDYEKTSRFSILFSKETFYKIQGLIGAILDKRLKEFNIKFDTFCKQHPIIRKELEKKASETSLIGISVALNSKAGTIHSLKKLMNTEWVEKLHGYQNEDINKFSETLSGVVASQTGLGKALRNSELVLTPNGFVRNDSLKTGDYVIGSNGKPIKILGVYPQQGKRDIYRVTFYDGTYIECDIEHLWTVRIRNGKKFKTLSLKEMLENGYYYNTYDKRYNTHNKRFIYSIPYTPPVKFGNDNNITIDPYLLGLLLGDGSIQKGSVSITIGKKKLHIINKIKLPKNVSIKILERKKGIYQIKFLGEKGKNKLLDMLRELGLAGKKSYEKFIPNVYKYASLKSRKAIIQGLIDTDGHKLKNGNIEFGSSSKKLINDYREVALSIGMRLGHIVVKEKPIYTHKGLKKIGRPAYRITERTSRTETKTIIDIKKVGEDFATCIKVDSPDNLYIAGLGYNLTHNTSIAFGTALKSLSNGVVKRVLFVVPNGVFDKWKMEVTQGRFNDNKVRTAQPLLREDKKDIVMFLDKKKYHEDYQTFIKDKTKRILFVTYDQLKQFKFKEETLKEFMPESDKDFQARAGQIQLQGYIPEFSPADWKIVQTAKNPIGYFEDGQFDLAIYDEAQYAKNAIKGGYSLKFASSITSSEVGVKSMFISAYLKRARHDGLDRGTILVTATPFTNTPYEIFVTLKKLGKLDFIKDYKDFQNTFMDVTEDELKSDLTENMLKVKIFRGLKNIDMLEKMGGLDLVSYRTAENEADRDVNNIDKTNLKPDSEIFTTSIEANDEVMSIKSEYVNLYELAKDYLKDKAKDESLKPPKELLNYDEKEIEKLAMPFNLLAKIDNLSRGTDLAKGYLTLNLVNVDDDKLIEKVVKGLKNKKVDDYEYQEVIVKGEMVSKKVTIKKTLEELAEEKNIVIYDNDTKLLTIPTLDSKILIDTLNKFEDFENVLDLDRFPKYKNMLVNINQELQNVENAKQIIFSLSITGAGIIEKLVKDYFKELEIKKYLVLSTKNIEKDKKENSDKDDTGELSKLQEKYNNSNVVTALVFTKATSTGVDFNNRTCAIHLLDIPYTPDVWEQAKGRAIRQGNPIKNVSVYTYLMDGTFDKAKVKIMSSKTAWQNDLLNSIGSGVAEISNVAIDEDIINKAIKKYGVNFTDEQLDDLIKEEKSKQNEVIQKQRDVKKNLLKNNIDELLNNKNRFKAGFGIDEKIKDILRNQSIGLSDEISSSFWGYNRLDNPKKETGKYAKLLTSEVSKIINLFLYNESDKFISLLEKDNKTIIEALKNIDFSELYEYSYIYKIYPALMLKGKNFKFDKDLELFKNNILELWGNKFETLQKQFYKLLNDKLNFIKDNYLMYKDNDKILKDTLESFKQLADNEEDLEYIDKIEKATNPDYIKVGNEYINKDETCLYFRGKVVYRKYNQDFLLSYGDDFKIDSIVSGYVITDKIQKPTGYDEFVKRIENNQLTEDDFIWEEDYEDYIEKILK